MVKQVAVREPFPSSDAGLIRWMEARPRRLLRKSTEFCSLLFCATGSRRSFLPPQGRKSKMPDVQGENEEDAWRTGKQGFSCLLRSATHCFSKYSYLSVIMARIASFFNTRD